MQGYYILIYSHESFQLLDEHPLCPSNSNLIFSLKTKPNKKPFQVQLVLPIMENLQGMCSDQLDDCPMIIYDSEFLPQDHLKDLFKGFWHGFLYSYISHSCLFHKCET